MEDIEGTKYETNKSWLNALWSYLEHFWSGEM